MLRKFLVKLVCISLHHCRLHHRSMQRHCWCWCCCYFVLSLIAGGFLLEMSYIPGYCITLLLAVHSSSPGNLSCVLHSVAVRSVWMSALPAPQDVAACRLMGTTVLLIGNGTYYTAIEYCHTYCCSLLLLLLCMHIIPVPQAQALPNIE